MIETFSSPAFLPPAATSQLPAAETFVDVLRRRALENPSERALTFLAADESESAVLSYGELDERARAIAARLVLFAAAGERALLLYPSGLEFVAAFFGCLYAGVIAVPVFPPRPNRPLPRLQAIVADAGATVALTTVDVLEDLERRLGQAPLLRRVAWLATDAPSAISPVFWRPPEISPGDPAYLQYTSGSTADPKGVRVTHANLLADERMLEDAWGNHAGATIVSWLPLYHDMGLIGTVLQAVCSGAHAVLMSPVAFLQQPARWLRAVSRYRARFSGGPNFAYDLCARKITAEQKAGLDLSGWEVAFSGAEPIRAATLRRFAAAFGACGFRWQAFCPGYGLAEATLAVTSNRWREWPTVRTVRRDALAEGRVEEGATENAGGDGESRWVVGCGRTLPGGRVAIVDPVSGARLPPGAVGEVWVAGPHVAAGYWNRPEETARVFGARLAGGEGPFLRTGDLGFELGGELFLAGRRKDLILVDGRNLYPQDVEQTVEECHPALLPGGGAAFAVERDDAERLVVAHEVRRHTSGGELAGIAAAIRRAVAEQHDARVHHVCLLRAGTLPKTSSGKVQRQACGEAFLAGALKLAAEESGDE